MPTNMQSSIQDVNIRYYVDDREEKKGKGKGQKYAGKINEIIIYRV